MPQGCPHPVRVHVPTRDVRACSKVSPAPPDWGGAPPLGGGVIEVEGLEKQYGDFPAVRGLTFTVHPGEVLGLVGPNGAGKTSTIRSIAGIIIPTRGRIRIGGHDLATEAVAAKSMLAFITDERRLFEFLLLEGHQ